MAHRTLELSGVADRVTLIEQALADTPGTAHLFSFAGLPAGHASLHDLGREDAAPVAVGVTTVDAYLTAAGVERVDLLKVDAEGHEVAVFDGADGLLRREDAPVVVFEVNREALTAREFDGNDVLAALRDRGYTRFWSLDARPYEPVDCPFDVSADTWRPFQGAPPRSARRSSGPGGTESLITIHPLAARGPEALPVVVVGDHAKGAAGGTHPEPSSSSPATCIDFLVVSRVLILSDRFLDAGSCAE